MALTLTLLALQFLHALEVQGAPPILWFFGGYGTTWGEAICLVWLIVVFDQICETGSMPDAPSAAR